MSDSFYSTVYHINDKGQFQCNKCPKTSGNATWAGKHYLKCEKFDQNEQKRRALLLTESNYRKNHSDAGVKNRTKYMSTEKGKANSRATRFEDDSL